MAKRQSKKMRKKERKNEEAQVTLTRRHVREKERERLKQYFFSENKRQMYA